MTTGPFIAACVQVCPGDDPAANMQQASDAIRQAVEQGAALVVLPEYVSFLHTSGSAMRGQAQTEADDPALRQFRRLAQQCDIWIVVGSIALQAGGGKLVNRSFLISANGDVAARYDKLHMFDVSLPNGRDIRESSTYLPGSHAVVARTPLGTLGLSVCYDVRFPYLYRALAQAGAEILIVPAAFTKATGALHWDVLLRARAIETGAYVVAAATCGTHPGGHQTYGHSMVVGPDGTVAAKAADSSGVICATIDLARVAKARGRIPSLTHDRAFDVRLIDASQGKQ